MRCELKYITYMVYIKRDREKKRGWWGWTITHAPTHTQAAGESSVLFVLVRLTHEENKQIDVVERGKGGTGSMWGGDRKLQLKWKKKSQVREVLNAHHNCCWCNNYIHWLLIATTPCHSVTYCYAWEVLNLTKTWGSPIGPFFLRSLSKWSQVRIHYSTFNNSFVVGVDGVF